MTVRSSFQGFQLFLNYKEFQHFNEYTFFQQHMDYQKYRQISDYCNTLHQQQKEYSCYSDYRLNYKKYEQHHHYTRTARTMRRSMGRRGAVVARGGQTAPLPREAPKPT